jgi:hypothetical protein
MQGTTRIAISYQQTRWQVNLGTRDKGLGTRDKQTRRRGDNLYAKLGLVFLNTMWEDKL